MLERLQLKWMQEVDIRTTSMEQRLSTTWISSQNDSRSIVVDSKAKQSVSNLLDVELTLEALNSFWMYVACRHGYNFHKFSKLCYVVLFRSSMQSFPLLPLPLPLVLEVITMRSLQYAFSRC